MGMKDEPGGSRQSGRLRSAGRAWTYDELRVSEEKYRQLFELESDAVWLVDNETELILEANAAAMALYGYTREELLTKNNGFINVYSEPGLGTTIRIYLPLVNGVPGRAAKEPEKRGTLVGSETILLVEDEESLLEIGRVFLERQGYTVLATRSPVVAMRVAADFQGVIHLVVTDVIMPDMNGRDLVDRLRALRPSMKSLYMSGYTANVIAHHGVLDPELHFIEKPFSLSDLSEKVREVLDK